MLTLTNLSYCMSPLCIVVAGHCGPPPAQLTMPAYWNNAGRRREKQRDASPPAARDAVRRGPSLPPSQTVTSSVTNRHFFHAPGERLSLLSRQRLPCSDAVVVYVTIPCVYVTGAWWFPLPGGGTRHLQHCYVLT